MLGNCDVSDSPELRVLLWNVEGLATVLELGAGCYLEKFSCFIFVETFRTVNTTISGFYTFESLAVKPKTGRGRPSLGILMGIKPELKPRLVYKSDFCIGVVTCAFNLIGGYFPPDIDSDVLTVEISEAISSFDMTLPTIIGGDFNARLDIANEKFDLLSEMLADCGFQTINAASEHTYFGPNGKSTIDLFFTNRTGFSCNLDCSGLAALRKHAPTVLTGYIPAPQVGEVSASLRRKRLVVSEALTDGKIRDIESLLHNRVAEDAYDALVELINSRLCSNSGGFGQK